MGADFLSFLANQLPEQGVCRHSAAEEDIGNCMFFGIADGLGDEGIHNRHLHRSGNIRFIILQPGGGLFGKILHHSRFQSAEAEIVVVGSGQGTGESDEFRISLLCQFVYQGTSGKTESQKLRHLVKGLPGSVVQGLADFRKLCVRVKIDKFRMSAGDNQRQIGRTQTGIFQMIGENVSSM